MVEENEILKKLVIEEKDIMKELEKMVEEASKYFRIEKPSGRIIFQNFGSLNDKQRIAVVLLGKYFASKPELNIIKDPSLNISDIAKELGKPVTSLSGDIKELVTKGYVEYLPGKKYRVAYHRIKEIFDDVLKPKK
jgi:predicted Rossmann fold nucleotide-binding protein DprA/Smf involved in DNA uptake